MPDVAIVILNYLNYSDTISCIGSIRSHQDHYMIYIVENGSANDSLQVLTEYFEDSEEVKIIASQTNLGFSRGNNLGIAAALKDGFDYIACINSDIVIDEDDAFDRLRDAAGTDDQVAVVGPNIVTIDGRIQNPFKPSRFSPLESLYLRLRWELNWPKRLIGFLKYLRSLIRPPKNVRSGKTSSGGPPHAVYALHGSFVFFTPAFFQHFIGFDENVFLHGEEFILAERIFQRGLKMLYVPSVSVKHLESRSMRKAWGDKQSETSSQYTITAMRYFIKHYLKPRKRR